VSAVFLDTVGLIALWDQSDQWHLSANGAFRKLEAARRAYITTTFVLLECGNAVSRRPYRQEVVSAHRTLAANNGLIVPSRDDWDNAWHEFERGQPGDPGIIDCVSMVVMQKIGISEIFTNDQHFAAAGFQTLF
jgi:predicted nucleic acid-binding protein